MSDTKDDLHEQAMDPLGEVCDLGDEFEAMPHDLKVRYGELHGRVVRLAQRAAALRATSRSP